MTLDLLNWLNMNTKRKISKASNPDIEFGYLKAQMQLKPPYEPQSWDDIMKDIEQIIKPGVYCLN